MGSPIPQLPPGHVIGGYTIEAFIAAGGTGMVYRAKKELLERTAAMKVLRADFVERKDTLGRFLREARLAASLCHPAIVKVYDVGEDDGNYYIVMEYVEGRDLSTIVKDAGRLPVGEALRMTRQIAEALAYAHERGIVHRDIKPGNILLTTTGQAKLTDLGLARPKNDHDASLTQAGQIMGTPAFMSPEQCRGLDVDARSDLYSLGATLYNLLTGNLPFDETSVAACVHRVVNDHPRPLDALAPEVPPRVVTIVRRLMTKYPGSRYQTAKEVVAAIDELRTGRFVFARESAPEPAPLRLPSVPWGRIVALVVLGTVLGIGVHFLWPHLTDASSENEPGPGTEITDGTNSERPRVDVPRRGNLKGRVGDQDGDGPLEDDGDEENGNLTTGDDPILDHSLARRASRDPALRAAARDFQRCLVTGALDDALEHVRSDLPFDPALQSRLTFYADFIASKQLMPSRSPMRQKGDAAGGLMMFREPRGGRSWALPVEWIRVDGEWYVNHIGDRQRKPHGAAAGSGSEERP